MGYSNLEWCRRSSTSGAGIDACLNARSRGAAAGPPPSLDQSLLSQTLHIARPTMSAAYTVLTI